MTIISVVVVAVVGGAYAFVPPFQKGVERLGYDIKETLGSGTFRGQGRVNASSMDTSANTNTLTEGGEQDGLPPITIPFFGISIDQQAIKLAVQRSVGGAPPTGIGRNSCGVWAISYIFNELGIPNADMSTLMAIAEGDGRSRYLRDCKADASGTCTDLSMDFFGLKWLGEDAGGQGQENPHRGGRGTYADNKAWLEGELAKGAHPAVMITDEHGQPHWVVMTGVVTDPETGTVTGYTFVDGRTGVPQTMDRAEFQDSWSRQANTAVSFGAPAPGNATASK